MTVDKLQDMQRKGIGMSDYRYLFEPMDFAGYRLKNRICVPPLVAYSWSDEKGHVTDKHVRHYHELVHGGAGLVRQEATCVSETGRITLDQLGIWNDSQKAGLSRIKDVFKEAGMPAIIQLSHAGYLSKVPEDRVGPVDCEFSLNGEQFGGRALETDEIHTIERQFIDAAERAYDTGYDGVELHACHGYLLSQFMNRRVNTRKDEYCASDNLMISNIIEGIRRTTSPDFMIGVRLGVFEPDLETGLKNAVWLESKGIAYIDAYYGCDWYSEPQAPEGFGHASCSYAAGKVKEVVSIPVFSGYGIRTGEQAEAVLRDTGIDMIVAGRAHLVNESWGRYVHDGLDPGTCFECAVCRWKVDPETCPGRVKLRRETEKISRRGDE